jgi:UPF0755 protein
MRRLGLILLLLIAAIGGFAAWLDQKVSRPYKAYRTPSVFVEIPKGTSRWAISGLLKKNKVIRSRIAFEAISRWHHKRALQAGEYEFTSPMTEREVFWKIANGKVFVYVVQIPEGWTMFDIADLVEKKGITTRAAFLKAATDVSLIHDLDPNAKNLEGYLFPSTYEFSRSTTPHQMVAAMVKQFRTVWTQMNASAGNPGVPAQDIVTMASLVERETPLGTERPLVAGVFYNRLHKGLPLQCDPTVAYALELAGHPNPVVHHGDLDFPSPYNTYEHTGLPPGPIANPGEASMRAALMPDQTDYLYFVADDMGGHSFSKTLAEHNREVKKYRKRLEDDAANQAPKAPTSDQTSSNPEPASIPR